MLSSFRKNKRADNFFKKTYSRIKTVHKSSLFFIGSCRSERESHNSLAFCHAPSGSIYNNIYFEVCSRKVGGGGERKTEMRGNKKAYVMDCFRYGFLQIQARKLLGK